MKITDIKIRKINDNSKLKAYVTVTFDDCFVVHNIKIIKGYNGFLLAMPNRKTPDGLYQDVAHPIDPNFRAELQEKILKKYDFGNVEDDFSVEY